jgi:nitroreductase
MGLQDVVQNRRSIRRFLPEAVTEETIRDLISKSLWAPSWGNTQPWEIVVATGSALERFKTRNKEALFAGKPSVPEIPMPQQWPESYKARYRDLGKRVLQALCIPRGDGEARLRHFGQMNALFDAPVLVLITIDKALSLEYAMLDVGLFLQTFCLLAHDRGLGTCILAAAVMYPEITREIFSIPENKLPVIGAALGRPEFLRWVK